MLNTNVMINNTVIKNRLVMPPMATSKSGENGEVTKELIDFYDKKTKGGYIGLIILEHAYVSIDGKAGVGQLSLSHNADLAGLKKLVETIQNNGSKVFAQINHAGGAAKREVTGQEIISSSSVEVPKLKGLDLPPKEMGIDDIDRVIKSFAESANLVKSVGFDGVEIHSAHAYLLNQFYSPIINKRDDDYNGHSIEGRIKLHLQIIDAVREAVGNDFPVAIRLGGCDYMEGGSTIEDCVNAAIEFEKHGVDLIDLSGGFCGYLNPLNNSEGYFSDMAFAVKNNVSVPVLLTGGVTNAKSVEKLLKEEKADLIGVGRAILKDDDLAKKIIEAI